MGTCLFSDWRVKLLTASCVEGLLTTGTNRSILLLQHFCAVCSCRASALWELPNNNNRQILAGASEPVTASNPFKNTAAGDFCQPHVHFILSVFSRAGTHCRGLARTQKQLFGGARYWTLGGRLIGPFILCNCSKRDCLHASPGFHIKSAGHFLMISHS